MFAAHRAKPQVEPPAPTVDAPMRPRSRAPEPAGPAEAEAVASQLPGVIQAQLTVGAVDDPLEREADRVSDEVASMPGGLDVASGPPAVPSCSSQVAPRSETAPASVHAALGGAGAPLSPGVREDMERRIGHDFSRVRVHAGTAAEQSARDVGANAYAVGPNIVFGADQYAPSTARGRRLIAHELTHVVQQSAADRLAPDRDGAAAPFAGLAHHSPARIAGRGGARVARNGPQIPPVLSFLTPPEIAKLRAFGDADFQTSLSTLEGHLRKTKGFTERGDTHKYIDIRQAAGELRAFRDYLNDPNVVGLKVVPSNMGGRSPDMYARYRVGDEFRVEVSNITLAAQDVRPEAAVDAQGRVSPKISRTEHPTDPGKTVVSLPVTEFKDSASIKAAIRTKIKGSTKGPSQLEAQNPNTLAGGRPMATGGDVVVSITHGQVDKARLDQIIKELEPELVASTARRVQIDSVDAAEPRAGRKIFEYSRQGQTFVANVRSPNRPAPVQLPQGPKVGAPGAPAGGRMAIVKGVGGAIFALVVHFALAAILAKVQAKLEEMQVSDALKKIEPQINERLSSLSGDVIERQSAGQAVFAKITYSLNYMRMLEDTTQSQLFFGETPADIETNRAFHDLRKAEQNMTILADATLANVTLESGEQPKDASSSSTSRHPSGTYETLTFTFEKSVRLQQFSDDDLRDYVLQQALAEEMNTPEGVPPSARGLELRGRLDRLQGKIAKAEETRRADREREQQADERRKQAKLADARAAQQAPPSPAPPLLAGPGPQPAARTPEPRQDPFNLQGGRQKTTFEQAGDSADIAEALKAEFVQKAQALKRGDASAEQLAKHREAVNQWIAALRVATEAWTSKGSPEWAPVKRMKFLVWWVDEPDGRSALLR